MAEELEKVRGRCAELEKERHMLHVMMDILPDCNIFLKDRQSRFILTNTAHLRVIGVKSLADVIGKTDFDFFPKELAQQYYNDEQQVMSSGEPLINREEQAVDPDGNKYWMLTTKMPLCAREGVITGITNTDHAHPKQSDIVGFVGLSRDITNIKNLEQDRNRVISELESALSKIKTLHGMIPICSSCKNVRNDEGYWLQVEEYVQEHSDADFSHGFCPDCAKKFLEESGLPLKPE